MSAHAGSGKLAGKQRNQLEARREEGKVSQSTKFLLHDSSLDYVIDDHVCLMVQ